MAGTTFVTSSPQHKDPAHHSPPSSMDRVDDQKTAMKPENFSLGKARSGNVEARKSMRIFSPMNENGCYEFDRVLKSGNLQKRTRKTKSWKPIHLVLRPHTLSIYADSDGTKLRHQIQLSDITSVARQRDPKRKERHVFALFSSERNYHIEASSETDAQQWVEVIRSQARIDEDEDEIIALMSPTLERPPGMDSGFFGKPTTANHYAGETSASEVETQPIPIPIRKSRSKTNMGDMHSAQRKSSVGLSYMSGAEQASYSDFSDGGFAESTLSLPKTQAEKEEHARKIDEIYQPSASQGSDRPKPQRSTSAISARNIQSPPKDDERVVYNGYLYLLKSKHGMRQWKSVWAVLRGKSLALYKNEEEYKPLYIIPFGSIMDAVDIDNLSKSKRHCFQVITEERQFKFCARSEEEVAKWVGGFKALLAKRRDATRNRRSRTPPR